MKTKRSDYLREYYQKNKVARARYAKSYRKSKGKDFFANFELKRKYGITTEEKLSILNKQGGKCAICSIKLSSSGKHSHVDHCHESQEVRGILCHNCNIGLGQFKDSKLHLMSAINYLDNNV